MTTAKIVGYPCLTETPYEVGSFVETVKRGAFKRTLGSKPDVVLNIDHGAFGLPMARTTNGTLKLSEDNKGLRMEAEVDPERSDVADVLRAMNRADLSQMSFAFTVMGGGQSWNNDFSKRELTSLNIHHGDVSIVVNGASPTTWATVDTTEGRKRIADEIGVSVRGFAPFSVEHSVEHADTGLLEVRLAPGTTKIKKCARCGTAGSITLAGQRITCPLCKGKGHNIITSGPTDAPAMSTVTDGRSRSEHERERLVALGWTPKTPRATSATATLVRPSRPDEAQRYERLLRGQRKIDEERKTETPQIGISDDDY